MKRSIKIVKKAAINPSVPEILNTVINLRHFVAVERARGLKIALVPTMGALHEGHLELVRQGLEQADCVITSIFVNPAQFCEGEDLETYPRTWDADMEKLEKAGVHAVFYPHVEEMYPHGFATNISVSGISERLCGQSRPGHFDGVATIVTKLLLQCMPDIALFGEKDYQQLQLIRQMVRDLNIPVEITGVPTVRDENGLALSSRNAGLDEEQYQIAIRLNKILLAMAERVKKGEVLRDIEKWGIAELGKAGFDSIDYLEICDAVTLQPIEEIAGFPARILAAVFLGGTRLIDNVSL